MTRRLILRHVPYFPMFTYELIRLSKCVAFRVILRGPLKLHIAEDEEVIRSETCLLARLFNDKMGIYSQV